MSRYMSPEEKEEILRLYHSGMQQKVIAAKFDRACSSVNYFIKQELEKKNCIEQSGCWGIIGLISGGIKLIKNLPTNQLQRNVGR